tara:strand:- start:1105 stop:1656 length:552 start_codon:yes stop_codon:yes gene_type:complete
MKTAERVVMVLIVLCFIFGIAYIFYAVEHDRQEVRDAVARGEYEIPLDRDEDDLGQEAWREIYPNTVPLQIGRTRVRASVADELSERIQGLSDTPFLPDDVVKLFVFGALGDHAIWMKDMNYSIDIMWASKEGDILHIIENVSPDTYPASFGSPVPSWYVIEAAAGFVDANEIEVGDKITLID